MLIGSSWLCFLVLGCVGFNKLINPAAPTEIVSDGSGSDGSEIPSVSASPAVVQWSPYLHVHATCEALPAYEQVMTALKSRGRLLGIRTGIDFSGATCVVDLASRLGLEVLGIIGNDDLLNPDLEDTLRMIYMSYPSVNYIQIGNEVTLAGDVNRQPMSNKQYFDIFKRAYRYTVENYPNKVLTTQAFYTGGYKDLEQLIKWGLLDGTDRRHLIITMNIYNKMDAGRFGNVVRNLNYERWVTESGVKDQSKHIKYVEDVYPTIKAQTGAGRIYFYTLWGGDDPPDTEFGLVRGVLTGNLFRSPLYDLLTH